MMTKICSKCGEEKPLDDFHNRKGVKDGKRPNCKICAKTYNTDYLSQPEIKKQRKIYEQKYILNNLDKIRSRRNQWFKDRGENDILFKLGRNLRNRISKFLIGREKRTEEILGITLEEFKMYLEKQFEDGMTWDKRSEWHIDHIIPLSSAKTKNEIYKLCHYTNLQPLWALDNIIKSNKTMVL